MISVLGSLQPGDKLPSHRQLLVKGKDRSDTAGSVLGLQTERMGCEGRCCPTLSPCSRGRASRLVALFFQSLQGADRNPEPRDSPGSKALGFLPSHGKDLSAPMHSFWNKQQASRVVLILEKLTL